jgi:hypothetical protein
VHSQQICGRPDWPLGEPATHRDGDLATLQPDGTRLGQAQSLNMSTRAPGCFAALTARACVRSRAADGARAVLSRQDCGLSRAAPHGTGHLYQRKGQPSCR